MLRVTIRSIRAVSRHSSSRCSLFAVSITSPSPLLEFRSVRVGLIRTSDLSCCFQCQLCWQCVSFCWLVSKCCEVSKLAVCWPWLKHVVCDFRMQCCDVCVDNNAARDACQIDVWRCQSCQDEQWGLCSCWVKLEFPLLLHTGLSQSLFPTWHCWNVFAVAYAASCHLCSFAHSCLLGLL